MVARLYGSLRRPQSGPQARGSAVRPARAGRVTRVFFEHGLQALLGETLRILLRLPDVEDPEDVVVVGAGRGQISPAGGLPLRSSRSDMAS